jgi:hypothetical protein
MGARRAPLPLVSELPVDTTVWSRWTTSLSGTCSGLTYEGITLVSVDRLCTSLLRLGEEWSKLDWIRILPSSFDSPRFPACSTSFSADRWFIPGLSASVRVINLSGSTTQGRDTPYFTDCTLGVHPPPPSWGLADAIYPGC